MRATVEDVHHGNGKNFGVGSPDIFEEWKLNLVGGRVGRCKRNRQQGVRPQLALVGSAVEIQQCFVQRYLVERVMSLQLRGDDLFHVVNGLKYALS